MINKVAKWVVRNPNLIIWVSVILLIPSLLGFVFTPVDYDILSFLPAQSEPGEIDDSNAMYGLKIVDEVFESSTLSIVIMEDLSPKEMDKICDNVNMVDGVSSATWVGSVADIGIPESMYPDAVKDMLYHEEDGHKSTLMLIQYEPDDPDNKKYDSIAKVNAVKEVLNEKCYVFGLSAVMSDTKKIVESEMFVYIAAAVILSLIVGFFTTKQWLMPVMIMAAMGCGVAYNMGTNFIFGSISYLTMAIGAILQMAVTIDYGIILLDRFEEECEKTDNVKKAMAKSISFSFISLMGGASTTFFGFIALCFMTLTIGAEIGIIMAKGIVFGFLSILIILPALILKFYKPIYKYQHRRFLPNFDKLIDFIIKHKKALFVVFIVLFIPIYMLNANVPTYSDMNSKMPAESPSLIASKKLTADYGITSMHVCVVNDQIPAGKVSKLIDEMEQVDGIKSVIGLNSFIGGGIPADILPDEIKNICEKGGYRLIVMFSEYGQSSGTNESGETKLRSQKNELTKIIKQYDPEGAITGETLLYDELVDIAEVDLVVTSLISIITVGILIAIAFKSGVIPFLLVAAVQFAIYTNLATSTLMNSEVIFLAPTVLGCVQLGATIDYAILLTSRYQEELKKGCDKIKAMSIAAKAASKSIFQSALTFLCATIGIVFVCEIELVADLCILLARGAGISAVVVIFFVPPLLLIFDKFIDKTTIGWKKESDINFSKGLNFMKKNKKTVKSVLSLFLCIGMILSFASCGDKETENPENDNQQQAVLYNDTAKTVTKTESVFINLNAMGQITKTTVTDWIHTDTPQVRVYDKTDLDSSKIQNVKGDTSPIINQQNPSEMMWNFDLTDVYYTGETNKKPPIEIDIKYSLNGEQISPEDVAGKSGTVKVDFEFKNTYSKAVKVNGTTRKIYLPMVVVGGTILSENRFSGIETQNGLTLGDGQSQIVAVYSLPGLSESLGIGTEDLQGYGDIQLNNKASVTMTTENFQLGNFYFAALPIASLNLKFDATNQVDSLQGALSVLKTLMGSLENIDLKGLMNILSANSGNISSLSSVLNDAIYVYEQNQVALSKLTTLLTVDKINALKGLLEEFNDPETQQSLSVLTNSEMLQSLMNLQELVDALEKAQPVMQEFSSVLNDPQVQGALDNLDETMGTLNKLQTEINKNQNLINMLTDVLSDSNLDSLSDISGILANSDINLADYGIIVDDTDAFVANCEAWVQVGKGYRIFTDAHETMNTNVAFIYMTESITHNYEPTQALDPQEETTALPWYKKIFS